MTQQLGLEARLQQLSAAGARANGPEADFADEASHLDLRKRTAWSKFLCSIATTESVEDLLIEPIREAFADSDAILRYLDAHGADERRHHELLTAYVSRTFGYVKRRRSGSDIVVYGMLLPGFSRIGRSRPAYLLTALHFYEAFSLEFYQTLKDLAARDGLPSLVRLIQLVEKDELRHRAGLEALIREDRRRHGAPGATDRLAIRSLLQLLLFDIDVRPWAFHNRRVRRNAIVIGIDPEAMGRGAAEAARESLAFATGHA
jgi:hypothetical protein